jgi:hypothetical protein
MRTETVEEFLARGGKITQLKSTADEYIKKIEGHRLNSRYHFIDNAVSKETMGEIKKVRRANHARSCYATQQRNKKRSGGNA